MPETFKVYDLTHLVKLEPFWMIVVSSNTDTTGLEALEHEVGSTLGIKRCSLGSYDNEKDARDVADGLSTLRPDIHFSVIDGTEWIGNKSFLSF